MRKFIMYILVLALFSSTGCEVHVGTDPKIGYFKKGASNLEFGLYQQAIEDFNQAVLINPKIKEAFINRGIAYGGLGKYQQAIADFNKAISINPNFPMTYSNRGNTYIFFETV